MTTIVTALILTMVNIQLTAGQFGFGGGAGLCIPDPKCYVCKAGCSLVDAFPFWRLTPTTCEECQALCQSKINTGTQFCCKSAVYDAFTRTCDLFAVTAGNLKDYPGRTYFQPTGAPGCAAANTTQAPAAAVCKDGETAKVISVKDYAVDGINGKDVPNVDADGCGKACLTGKLPDGSSVACKSALFKDGKCTISQDEPKKEADFKQASGADYFILHCFPSDIVKGCPDIFEEDPQKILVGQNKLTTDKSSVDECIKACLTSEKDNGFQCKSGMFYYKEGKLNCILNVESKGSKPDLFVDAPSDDNEVYFELGCGGGKKYSMAKKAKTKAFKDAVRDIPDEGPWALWSKCHGKKGSQVRFRQCPKYDSRKCPKEERSCDPAKRNTSSGKKNTDGKLIDDKKKKTH